MRSAAGRTLGEFVVGEPIGRGGYGDIYIAEQPALARSAVIKVLSATAPRPQQVAHFLREARLASRLDHPYAAHIYAFGAEPDGLLWIAMEHVRGTTLADLIATQGRIPLARFLPLFEKLCEVVQTAHEQGIVHRDLKPENVMVVARAGRLLPKLLDLGIAGSMDDAEPSGRGIVGSPRTMAPEQWLGLANAGPAADQYALAAIAFEALSGSPPFDGSTLEALAAAHAIAPPPTLPDDLPGAVSEALARGMAKRPPDRHADVLALWKAVRAACDGGGEHRPPELEPDLFERVLASYPQPIADAVAAYAAARTGAEAVAALAGVERAIARWIGVIALACWRRVGRGRHEPGIDALVVMLRRQGLQDGQWLDLARLVCRAFADKPDAHPIPELVLWFYPPGGAGVTTAPPLEELAQAEQLLDPAVARSAAQLGSAVERGLALLAPVLRSLDFLASYRLVNPVEAGVGAAFVGVSRGRDVMRRVRGAEIEPGRPLLIDASETPALALWPLVQIAEPSPGVAWRVFLVDGPGRRGARLTSIPDGLELGDEALWERFGDDGAAESFPELSAAHPPYLGMSAFTTADADWFFGREREVEAVTNRVRTQPLVAVLGPSGAGKSSLVHAGVLPELGPRWSAVSLRPGPAPMVALAAGLAREAIDLGIGDVTAADPAAIGDAMRAWAHRNERGLILVWDQFEELFAICGSDTQRARALDTLAAAARSIEDPVRAVITLRDDFLMRAEREPTLRPLLTRGLHLLGNPGAADLERMLVAPAQRAGYQFEDRGLAAEMASEVVGKPGSLPLLSFTAAQLWERRDRRFRQLTRQAYRAIGGVGGALAQHAEHTLAAMSAAERRVVRQVFRQLVTADGTRAALSPDELASVLGEPEIAQPVVDKLVAARLLVSRETEQTGTVVEVVHEALLTAWPRLVEWRREDAEGARLRDQLRAAARQWDERDRPRGLLWRGDALAELQRWRKRSAAPLTEIDRAFADASAADATRSRRIRQLAIAAVFALLCVGMLLQHRANQRAQRSATESANRLTQLVQEQGREAYLAGRPIHALLYLHRARELGADGAGLRYMLARTVTAAGAELATLSGDTAGVRMWWVDASADGQRLAIAADDGTATVWDARSGRAIARIPAGDSPVMRVQLSPDARVVAVLPAERPPSLWDVASGARVAVLDDHAGRVNAIAFAPAGDRIITAGADGTARMFDRSGAAVRVLLHGAGVPVTAVAISPEGARAVTAGDDRIVRVWNLATGEPIASLAGHGDRISAVKWSPDGAAVATASFDGTARLWDPATGRVVHSFADHRAAVTDLSFAGDGARLATVSRDHTARVWDVRSGDLVSVLEGHTGYVNRAVFSPDGRVVYSCSQDATARAWDGTTGLPIATFAGHGSFIFSMALFASGTRLATASWDGTTRLWDVSTRQLIATVPGAGSPHAIAVASSDRQWLVTVGEDGTTRTWDAATGHALARLDGARAGASAAAFAADRVAIAVGDRVLAWDARTGARATERSLGRSPIVALAGSPDGQFLAALDESGAVHLLDPRSLAAIAERAGTGGPRRALEFSPDSRALAIYLDGVAVLDVPSLATRHEWKGHDSYVSQVAFAGDGNAVVTSGYDGTVIVWDRRTGDRRHRLRHGGTVSDVDIDPASGLIAAAGADGNTTVWDVNTGELRSRLGGHGGNVSDVAWSPDGSLLLTVSWDGTASMWESSSLSRIDRLPDHGAELVSGGFVGDGSRVYTHAREGINLWDASRLTDVAAATELVDCRLPLVLGERGPQPRERPGAGCRVTAR